jgi:hypothetical protein
MIATLIVVGFVAAFCWATFRLSTTAGIVHGKLDEFMAEANATTEITKLRDINKRLIAYAKANCWHKHFGNHAKEVNMYICAKSEGIKSCSLSS